MSAEFEDVTARIRVGDHDAFCLAVRGFPDAAVVGVTEYVPHPKEEVWKEDIAGTKALVEQTKEAVAALNPVSMRGFLQLHRDMSNLDVFKELGLGVEDFVLRTCDHLSISVSRYEDRGPTRAYGATSQARYARLGAFLSPGEVRSLVNGYVLNGGQPMSGQEIAEGTSESLPEQVLTGVRRHLMWGLKESMMGAKLASQTQ